MQVIRLFAAICLFAFGLSSCVQPPDYPNEPIIEYVGVNQNIISQGNGNSGLETLAVTFSFTDGDGDIGATNDSLDVALYDSRQPDGAPVPFRLPIVPDQGTGNGISGEITVRIDNQPFNICCTYPDGSPTCFPNANFPTDTFSYTIQIQDRAGNLSNRIQTEVITILCN
jgi:hypothetical protein